MQHCDTSTHNPRILLRPIQLGSRNITVADDGVLPGGTKQRLLSAIMCGAAPNTEYVYAGPPQGAAQAALAIVAKHYGLRATIFTYKTRRTALTARAIAAGAKVYENREPLAETQTRASEYAAAAPNRVLVPFGLKTPEYIAALTAQLREAWRDADGADLPDPERMWMVIGSGTVYLAYHALFPNTQFHIVQVGKRIWPDEVLDRTTLYVHPQKFIDVASALPPYPSVATYDAKLWYFRDKFEDGDVIVNVAADAEPAAAAAAPVQKQGAGNNTARPVIPNAEAAKLYTRCTLQEFIAAAKTDPAAIFPYKAYAMRPTELDERFARLQKCRQPIVQGAAPIFNLGRLLPEIGDYAGRPQYIRVAGNDYWDYDLISDGFTETARIQCRRNDSQSSADYWNEHWRELVQDVGTDATALRDELTARCHECTTFRPSLAVTIFKHLCGPRPRILDISAGWGDRLAAALAVDASRYLAADPNLALQPGYAAMRQAFAKYTSAPDRVDELFRVVPVGFEDLDTSGEFDILLSSPPYWTLELYSPAETQSITSRTGDSWYTDFLMVSVRKGAEAVRRGGYVVININDARDQRTTHVAYTLRMVNDMRTMQNLEYIGMLPQWSGNRKKSGQPFWVFRRI